jgi:hypothetical protein
VRFCHPAKRRQSIRPAFKKTEEPSMTEKKATKLERLRQQKARLEMQIAAAESAAKAQARKLDTRRKVLVGAAVLADLDDVPGLRDIVHSILSRHITRDIDKSTLADLLNPSENPLGGPEAPARGDIPPQS